jgi:hypothetical protein
MGMDLRRFASPNARLPVLALLVGVAVVGLSARPPEAPAGARPETPAPVGTSFTVLIALAVPAAVLVVIAAARYRRRATHLPPVADRRTTRQPYRWAAALALLVLLTATVAGSVLAARLSRPAPEPASATPAPTPAPPAADPPPAAPESYAWLLIAGSALLTLMIIAAIVHFRATAEDPGPTPPPVPTLAEAVHRALTAVIHPAADPKAAIIGCYAAMESALTAVPAAAPHAADSPSEVLDRAATLGAIHSPGAWRLVELFDEARFSPHPMTEHDRTDAAAALRVILADLEGARR